ncbi:hypothetical protein AB1Y20_011992 [Prymnesium parvum]|uniref:Zeta toxin domain-containing protein n=1 Tax=Prymnesium parvum TaxID=97485 RepID=A0AB34IN85_PRYPA
MASRRFAAPLLLAASLAARVGLPHADWARARVAHRMLLPRSARASRSSAPRRSLVTCCDANLNERKPWSFEDPETMRRIGRALLLDAAVAPQWRPPAANSSAATAKHGGGGGTSPPPPLLALPQLREEELLAIAEHHRDDHLLQMTDADRELLNRSVQAIDYLGNWSCANCTRDSIVLHCARPRLIHRETGSEYTCGRDDFEPERKQLHQHIVQRMLTRQAAPPPAAGRWDASAHAPASAGSPAAAAAEAAAGGPPSTLPLSPHDQHVFFVVGVPGSGKDTVLKRYIRSLGLDLLDASADLVKEYLAAWGQDELSRLVRENNAKNGPGKHLLHAQYLHRESIMIVDEVVERALQACERKSIVLEKTLYNLEQVLKFAQDFREKGCRVHLFGTHITPRLNWDFLSYRMKSGQSFGRHISSNQTVSALRKYQANLEALISDEAKRSVFDGIHVYSVVDMNWCVSISTPRGEDGKAAE